ncbi:MAG: hypothetical protein KKB20_03985 [Proteobacteria bacterium]|nr:hypothetical protein [Pseudomonadota bacterium]
MDIDKAAEMIRSRGRVMAFTGAGVSAESGISTYRDPGGLWDRYGSEGMLSVLARHPDQAHEILGGFFSALEAARPNPAHVALARLEALGYLDAVATQNVDSLHREAGNRTVFELHGSLQRLRCLACGRKQGLERSELFDIVRRALARTAGFSLVEFARHFPACDCGGPTRLDFVSFGESVQDLPQAMDSARACRVMLIIGTSGLVYPAASLPEIAKTAGAALIEVNARESELTPLCDLFVQSRAGEALPLIVERLDASPGQP